MRIFLLLLSMTLLSGAADIYIYRRVIRRRFGIRGRGVYIAVCLLLDLLVAGGLLWLRYGPGDAPIMLTMWLLAIFFAHAVSAHKEIAVLVDQELFIEIAFAKIEITSLVHGISREPDRVC